MKITAKLILSMLAGFIIVAIVGGFFSFSYTKNILEKNKSDEQLNLARQAANQVDYLLYERYLDIQIISGSSALRNVLENNVSFEEGKDRFDALNKTTGPWDTILLAGKDGKIIFSDDKNQVGRIINPEDYPNNYNAFESALAGNTYYSDVVISKITGKPTIIFSAPVRYFTNGEIVGVAVAQLSWDSVLDILNTLGPDSTHVHIYNKDGLLIGSNLKDQNQNILKDNLFNNRSLRDSFGKTSFSKIMQNSENTQESLVSGIILSGYKDFKGDSWMILLETSSDIAFSSAVASAIRQLLIISGSLLFLLLIILLLINFFVIRKIKKLTKVTKKIKEGEVDDRVEIESKDEIGELGESFNEMVSQLQESKNNIEKKVQERTADLEKMNSFMVGRELKMIELKKRISNLEKK
jgi:methyl-accepting chemotaxis protein